MKLLMRQLLRSGWRRGMLGGSRPWLIIGGVALAVRLLQRVAASDVKVVFSEELQPGEAFVIGHGRPT